MRCACLLLLLAGAQGLSLKSAAPVVSTTTLGGGHVLSAAAAPSGSGEWDMVLFSPAKINLFLRVVRKREDGFHELASLFQAVDLGDTLSFRALAPKATADEFECNVEGVPTDDTNLVLRALSVFREQSSSTAYFSVKLEKNTPIQAGLGGGSSNAATALWAANELCGRPATPAQLEEWSGDLGSDVTFFLGPTGTAYCTGRGEIVEGVDPLTTFDDANMALFIVKPSMGLSTPLVFGALAKSNYETLRKDREPLDLLKAFSAKKGAAPADYVNDLEPPAFECAPVLQSIKEALLDPKFNFDAAMMSGSGTSLFALADASQAKVDFEAFPKMFEQQCKDELDIDVRVYRTSFLRRKEGGWYDGPN